MNRPFGKLLLGIGVCALWSALCCLCAILMTQSVNNFRSPLAHHPPKPGPPVGETLTRRVVMVLIDGLRDDTSRDPAIMPFLHELRRQGASASMHSREPSRSQSGYATLLTGGWCEVSDAPAQNFPADEIYLWTADTLFAAAHRGGLKTAIAALFWFERELPKQTLDASYFNRDANAAADKAVVQAGMNFLKKPDYHFVLIHINQVDTAGHEFGVRSSEWRTAAAQADNYVRKIVALLDLSQDTVLVVSDHGHIDRGGHGGGESMVITEPFVLAGKDIRPGDFGQVQMIDVAPTLAVLLGVNIPASSQGHVLTRMLKLPPEQVFQIDAALAVQQRQLSDAYQDAIGYHASTVPSHDPVVSCQAQMVSARAARLQHERLIRVVPAIIILGIPGLLLFRQRRPGWLRVLGAACAYQLLFNLVYIFVARRHYSVSGFTGPGALVLSILLITGLTFLPVWFLVVLTPGTTERRAEATAENTLALMLVSLYLLAFPLVFHYTYNGILYPWALPEFQSFFLALLAAAQTLSVTIVGASLMVFTLAVPALWACGSAGSS